MPAEIHHSGAEVGALDRYSRLLLFTILVLALQLRSAPILVGFPIIVLFVSCLIEPRLIRERLFWLFCGVVLGLYLLRSPYRAANHHYLLTYLVFTLAIVGSVAERARQRTLRVNLRALLVSIMVLATAQKLMSESFMDGSYLYLEFLRGSVFKSLLPLISEQAAEIAAANRTAIGEFLAADPIATPSVVLTPLPVASAPWAPWFALLIVAYEALIALAFLVRPFSPVSHLLLLAFIVGTFVTRQESVFLSSVSLMGLGLCPGRLKLLGSAYVVLVVLLLGFGLLGILHPL